MGSDMSNSSNYPYGKTIYGPAKMFHIQKATKQLTILCTTPGRKVVGLRLNPSTSHGGDKCHWTWSRDIRCSFSWLWDALGHMHVTDTSTDTYRSFL